MTWLDPTSLFIGSLIGSMAAPFLLAALRRRARIRQDRKNFERLKNAARRGQ